MAFVKKYDLSDPKDVEKLNKLLNLIGISIEQGLLGLYVLVDKSRFDRYTRRRAGRRTVCTQSVRQKVFTLKSEKKTIREIAADTGISIGTVMKILEDYEEEEETDQLRLFP